MESMQDVIERLEKQRDEYSSAADRLNKALELIRGDGATSANNSNSTANPTRKTMSAAARRKISIAMKRRHAAARNAKPAQKKLHWTQTPEGRKKFATIRAKAHKKAA